MEDHIKMMDEWNMWQRVCGALDELGIDINDDRADTLARAIETWGELLVALRLTQNEKTREEAQDNAIANFNATLTV